MAHITAGVTAPLGALEVAERFDRIAAMIDAGNPREARRALAALVAAADAPTAALLQTCLQTLERHPSVAVPKFRHLWRSAAPDQRVLIEAVTPRVAAAAPRPAAPARAGAAPRAPREQGSRQQRPRGSRSEGEANAARSSARYFGEQAQAGHTGGIDGADAEDREALLAADEVEYEDPTDFSALAMIALYGTPCVVCWIERATCEWRRADDDGLCGTCRDRGVVGVAVPAGAGRAERVLARVAHIAAGAAHRDAAMSLLRREWHTARGADKTTIREWVGEHLPAPCPA